MPSEQFVNVIIAIINYLSMTMKRDSRYTICFILYKHDEQKFGSASSLTRPSTDRHVAWFWQHPDFETKFLLLHTVNAIYPRFITITGSIPLLVDY